MKVKITKYKLTDRDGYTRRGAPGETYWLDGKEKKATKKGNEMCTGSVIHYYAHPLLAVLFNPIHANIRNPRLIEIEIDAEIANDGLKGGCKKARYIKEVILPEITTEQRITFAIKVALEHYKDNSYSAWAKDWLNGKDRSAASAASAARAARDTSAASAAWAAWDASVAWDAWAASAAWAAWAARVAWAARDAWDAWAAWDASAARAARAVRASEINKFFIKIIKEVTEEEKK